MTYEERCRILDEILELAQGHGRELESFDCSSAFWNRYLAHLDIDERYHVSTTTGEWLTHRGIPMTRGKVVVFPKQADQAVGITKP